MFSLFFLTVPIPPVPPTQEPLPNPRAALENIALPQKEDIEELFSKLLSKGYVIEEGGDELRVKFVLLQGMFEHLLTDFATKGKISHVIGMIHAPMPATPLCTIPEEIDPALLDKSIQEDPAKLLTVSTRAQIIRDYLQAHAKLYILYPEGGLQKRTDKEQSLYKEQLTLYSPFLEDKALTTSSIDPSFIGASYFFTTDEGDRCCFSIQSRQSNDTQGPNQWGVWLGSVDNPVVKERIDLLFSYFESYGGPERTIFISK